MSAKCINVNVHKKASCACTSAYCAVDENYVTQAGHKPELHTNKGSILLAL